VHVQIFSIVLKHAKKRIGIYTRVYVNLKNRVRKKNTMTAHMDRILKKKMKTILILRQKDKGIIEELIKSK
jgi:hypothetical protein